MQSYKPDLFGNLGRLVISPLRSIYYWAVKRGAARQPPMGVDKQYSPRQLDGLLGRFDFVRTGHAFNNFYVVPRVLQFRFPRFYISVSEAMTRSNPAFWRFLAVNYIGKYMLEK